MIHSYSACSFKHFGYLVLPRFVDYFSTLFFVFFMLLYLGCTLINVIGLLIMLMHIGSL